METSTISNEHGNKNSSWKYHILILRQSNCNYTVKPVVQKKRFLNHWKHKCILSDIRWRQMKIIIYLWKDSRDLYKLKCTSLLLNIFDYQEYHCFLKLIKQRDFSLAFVIIHTGLTWKQKWSQTIKILVWIKKINFQLKEKTNLKVAIKFFQCFLLNLALKYHDHQLQFSFYSLLFLI